MFKIVGGEGKMSLSTYICSCKRYAQELPQSEVYDYGHGKSEQQQTKYRNSGHTELRSGHKVIFVTNILSFQMYSRQQYNFHTGMSLFQFCLVALHLFTRHLFRVSYRSLEVIPVEVHSGCCTG